jgi:hypothetical protein
MLCSDSSISLGARLRETFAPQRRGGCRDDGRALREQDGQDYDEPTGRHRGAFVLDCWCFRSLLLVTYPYLLLKKALIPDLEPTMGVAFPEPHHTLLCPVGRG